MARIFNIGGTNTKEIDIDINVDTKVDMEPTPLQQIKYFVTDIWDSETIQIIKTMILFVVGIVVLFFALAGIKSTMPKQPLVIISNFNPSSKEWVVSDSLNSAINNGDIDISKITVTYVNHEVTFSDNRIIVTNYETVIEKNENPKIYSDEYYNELVKQGKNTYIRKYITLADESTESEGAE